MPWPALPMTASMMGRHTDSEYRRLRAYESLLIFAVAIAMALLVGGTAVVTISRPLHAIGRALGPTP
jgi:hypothetical protein